MNAIPPSASLLAMHPVPPAPPAPPAPLELLDAGDLAAVERAFHDLLPVGPGVEAHLRGALGDLLAHPGSLARAQLAFGLMSRRGAERDQALRLAVAVEYFHTASLVFDDMPAMDDAGERRGHPCVHRVWGEAAATLAALALVTRGYALLWEALGPLPAPRRRRAAAIVDECLGVAGILDGQSRDLHHIAPEPSQHGAAEEALAVARGKTVPLIRLALVLPALAAGVDGAALANMERLAEAWGLAYQAIDDFKDLLMDAGESGKSPARDALLGRPSLPRAAGCRAALARLRSLLADGRLRVATLEVELPELPPLLDRVQRHLEGERRRVLRRLRAGRRC